MHHLEVLVLGTGSTQGVGEAAVMGRPHLSDPTDFPQVPVGRAVASGPQGFVVNGRKFTTLFLMDMAEA